MRCLILGGSMSKLCQSNGSNRRQRLGISDWGSRRYNNSEEEDTTIYDPAMRRTHKYETGTDVEEYPQRQHINSLYYGSHDTNYEINPEDEHILRSATDSILVSTVERQRHGPPHSWQVNCCWNKSSEQQDILVADQENAAVVFRQTSKSEDDGDEAVLGINPRSMSLAANVQNNGQHSGIVGVISTFGDGEGGTVCTWGSGTIIDDHHVLTAGHTVWHRKYGPATSTIICRDIRADPRALDERRVDTVGVQYRWAKGHEKQHDFAVLYVSKRFPNSIKRMKCETPTVQYPIRVQIYGFDYGEPEGRGRNRDGRLFSSSGRVQHEVSKDKLFSHDGDTEEGASGGPVVDIRTGSVIAVHRGWGRHPIVKTAKTNEAVVINHHGNDVDNFITALSLIDDIDIDDRTPAREARVAWRGTLMWWGTRVTIATWA